MVYKKVMYALIGGVAVVGAAIAFHFMSKEGSRSLAGLAASGLFVAVGFYLARRYFVDK